jgi:hypothetical protein
MDCIWNKLSTLAKNNNSRIQVKCTNTQKKVWNEKLETRVLKGLKDSLQTFMEHFELSFMRCITL